MSSFRSVMVSPSSSTTDRTVPWVAGWLGPRLISIFRDGNGASSGSGAAAAAGGGISCFGFDMGPLGTSRPGRLVPGGGTGAAVEVGDVALGDQRLPPAQRVVLAQGVPHELLVHVEAARIGVPREEDAVHVAAVALEPVGPAPHRGDGVHGGVRLRHFHPEANPVVVPGGVELVDDLEARLDAE